MSNSFSSITTGHLKKDKERQSLAHDRIANRSVYEAKEARKEISKARTQAKGKQSWTKRQHEEAIRLAKLEVLREARFAVSGAIKSISDPRTHDAALAAITGLMAKL